MSYYHVTDEQQPQVWKVLPQNLAQSWSSTSTRSCPSLSHPPQHHWYFGRSYKHLAMLEADRMLLFPRISQRILCVFSVPNQACCVHDGFMREPSISNTSQMDKNSRRPKSPSYPTRVQLRRDSHLPLICTHSEMKMGENSYKPLTATLEFFMKDGDAAARSVL